MGIETKLEVITARSRDDLYRQLFEQFGTMQYHIIDERARRRFPFFWRKEYEMKVMLVLEPEPQPAAVQEPAIELIIPEMREDVQAVLRRLEDSPVERLPRSAVTEPRRKEELLRLLDLNFSVLPAGLPQAAAAVPQQEVQQLKEAIELIQRRLSEQQHDSSPVFSDLLFGNDRRPDNAE